MRNPRRLFLLVMLVACPALAQTSAGTPSSRDPKAPAVVLDPQCLAGQWHEQVDNAFRWIFEVHGNRLKIWRTDHFVSGRFKREGSTWKGELKWGNGETWRNVLLAPTPNCDEVHTNQSWWFRRS